VLAYPPQRSRASARATRVTRVVYLHGVHGKAENGCPWLRTGASELGWLVCPEANERLANGTFSWAGSVSDVRAVVARAEHAIVNEGAEPDAPGVLVGFSQGAYVALDLVRAEPGRWGGLVLLGAEIEPNAASLRSAGVSRVALLAGDLDGSSASVKRAAVRRHRGGIAATFKSLGRVGHTYVGEDRDALHDAIVWAGG